ncbi:MAG: hypothetical protein JWL84_3216, partial [Rhodospirillales bacterium]|nr:hypothetical protein [Rhodospirillales bacterium]
DAVTLLESPILDAIKRVTGRRYQSIDKFNDHPATTHATVLKVLHQARENIRAAELSPALRYWRRPESVRLQTWQWTHATTAMRFG